MPVALGNIVNLHCNSSFLVGSGIKFEGLKNVSTVKPAAAASAGLLHKESVQAAAALDSVDVDAIAYLGLPGALAAGAFGAAAATDLLDATLFQDLGKPAVAATDLLDAPGSTAIVLGDNGFVLNSSCMTTLSAAAGAANFRLTSRVRSLQRATGNYQCPGRRWQYCFQFHAILFNSWLST